jgi:hypothetical protein
LKGTHKISFNINRKQDRSVHLSQPQLIKGILKDLRLDGKGTKRKTALSMSSKILTKHEDSVDRSFDYWSIVGKLNYLEKVTRADISYIAHQCARFAVEPKKEHGEAIRWLGRYLKGPCDKGLILKPDGISGLKAYVNADFMGIWDLTDTMSRDRTQSWHGYITNLTIV